MERYWFKEHFLGRTNIYTYPHILTTTYSHVHCPHTHTCTYPHSNMDRLLNPRKLSTFELPGSKCIVNVYAHTAQCMLQNCFIYLAKTLVVKYQSTYFF